MPVLLLKALPYLAVVAAFCGWTYGSYHYGASHQAAADKNTFDAYVMKRNAGDAAALKQATADKAAQEKTWGDKMAAIDQQHQQEIDNASRSYQAAVLALRTGTTLRLRQQHAATPSSGSVPGAADASGVSDGSQASGLSEANAEFLLQLGADADAAVNQLSACQAVVRADRAAPSP